MQRCFILLLIYGCGLIYPVNAQNTSEVNVNGAYFYPAPSSFFNTSKDVVPVSPQAASLGVYGQIPVGCFTGTAQIGIPLYEIKYKELSVPITLHYHASGNRPDALPGPVGLGWALQAGGIISRQINGGSDIGRPMSSSVPRAAIVPDPREDEYWPNNLSSYMSDVSPIEDMNTGFGFSTDPYPDEYNFNINGHTGKFYLNHKDTFQICSDQGGYFQIIKHKRPEQRITFLKIDHVPPGVPRPGEILWDQRLQIQEELANFYGHGIYDFTYNNYNNTIKLRDPIIGGFTMIDQHGIKYLFGADDGSKKSDKSIEFSRPAFNMNLPFLDTTNLEYIQPVSWMLTAIESPQGYKIEFIYEQESYVTKTRFTDRVLYQLDNNTRPTTTSSAWTDDGIKASFINGCFLKEIVFPTGKALFTATEAWQQLSYAPASNYKCDTDYINFQYYPDIRFANTERICNQYDPDCSKVAKRFFPHKVDMIRIVDVNMNVLRKINFEYTTSTAERLKLLSLKIGSPAKEEQVYSFTYNTTLPLPPYLAGQTDHYGFYNGKKIFPDNIGYNDRFNLLRNDPNYIYDKKTPDGNYAQAEILTKIVYPTKGYSAFEYEPHVYAKQCSTWPFTVNDNNRNQETGGVRIKSIKNYDSDGSLLAEKKYHYETNYLNGGTLSSGVLAYIPLYRESYKGKRIIYGNTPPQNAPLLTFFERYATTSLYNVMAARGNHITYTEVTVEEPDNGYTVYNYKNHDNGYNDREPLFHYSNKLTDLYGTMPVEFWKADEGISMSLERGQLLSETVYDYAKNKKKKIISQYNDDPNRFNENVRYFNTTPNSIHFTTYKSDRVTAGVIYTYFPYLKENTEANYFGKDSIVQRTNYAYDTKYRLNKSRKSYDSQNQEYSSEAFYTVDQDHAVPVVEQMMSKGMVAYPFQTIARKPNNETETIIYRYSNDIGSAVPQLHQKSKVYTNNAELLETAITRYDSYGNPNEMYEHTTGNSCILWSYKGQYPIAKIHNVTYTEVVSQISGGQNTINAITASDTLSSNAIATLNDLRAKLPQAQVFTYTYKPLVGLLSETDPKGFTIYYDYDDFGRLKRTYYIENDEIKIKEFYDYNYKH